MLTGCEKQEVRGRAHFWENPPSPPFAFSECFSLEWCDGKKAHETCRLKMSRKLDFDIASTTHIFLSPLSSWRGGLSDSRLSICA